MKASSLGLVPVLLLVACATERAADPLGGQAGDDGDLHPDDGMGPPVTPTTPPGPGVPPPIPPPIDDCDEEQKVVPDGEATVFGVDAQQLIDNLELPTLPLHWVDYDQLENTTYLPGPSETEVQMSFERTSADVEQLTRTPREGGEPCAESRVSVPVTMQLSTSDHALDLQVDATLQFRAATLATLEVELDPAMLGGSFEFTRIASDDPSQIFRTQYLYLDAAFWSGGSRGSIFPSFVLENPPAVATPPAPASPPSSLPPSEPNAVSVREHWRDVAVWPTDLTCTGGGTPFTPDDEVAGVSARQVRDELLAQNPWVLQTPDGDQTLEIVPDDFAKWVCPQGGWGLTSALDFELPASVRAIDGEDGPLAGLDARFVVHIGLSDVDPTAPFIRTLRVTRRNEDAVDGISRAQLEEQTGIGMNVPDEYQQFWWAFQATLTRSAPDEPFTYQSEFVVSSLNAEQTAEIQRIASQGGPPSAGVGIDNDGWLHLPGDELLRATSASE